jgi:hypothetical protein
VKSPLLLNRFRTMRSATSSISHHAYSKCPSLSSETRRISQSHNCPCPEAWTERRRNSRQGLWILDFFEKAKIVFFSKN